MEPLALNIAEVCAAARMGRTRVYDAIKAGQLRARKNGRRTIVLADDLRHWLENLPTVNR